MPRISRQESQQLTRQKLIDAATGEICRTGIYSASIRRICDAAGFTLGAFYSNFISKDELLLAVIDIQTQKEFAAITALVTEVAELDKNEALEKIAEWLRALRTNKFFSDLLLEFEVYSNHNPQFKASYDESKRRWHAEVESALTTLFKGQRITPRISPSLMAVGLTALWVGYAVESTVSEIDSADKVISVFIEAMLESSKP